MFYYRIMALVSVFLAVFLGGCISTRNPASESESSGSASFRISISPDSPFKRIARSAEILISSPDMATIAKPLEIMDSTIEGKVDNIPAGKDRRFEVKVYDSTGTERYRGSASGAIKAYSVVSISLPIIRIVGSAVINGTIIESGIEMNDSSTTALFEFDEGTGSTTSDAKNGIIGTLHNTTWTGNGTGFGVTFNGTDSYIATNSSAAITLKDTFSIDIVFRSPATTERRILLGMRQPESFSAEVGADGKVMIDLQGDGAQAQLIGENRVDDGKWHSLTIVRKGRQSLLYVDGVLEADCTDASLKMDNNTNALIGHLNLAEFPARFFYRGDIDLIRFSNVARTAAEALALSSLAGAN